MLLILAVPLVVLTYVYVQINKKGKMQLQSKANETSNVNTMIEQSAEKDSDVVPENLLSSPNDMDDQTNNKIFKMMLVVFFLCHIPCFLINFTRLLINETPLIWNTHIWQCANTPSAGNPFETIGFVLFELLLAINCASKFFICNKLSPKFKKALASLSQCCKAQQTNI